MAERRPGNENKRGPHKSGTIDALRELNRHYDCGVIGHDKDLNFGVLAGDELQRDDPMTAICSILIVAGFHITRLVLQSSQEPKNHLRGLFFVSDVCGYGDLDKQLFLAGVIFDQLGFKYMPVDGDSEIIYTATDKRDSHFVGHRMKEPVERFYENGGWFSQNEKEDDISVAICPCQYCFGSGMRAWGAGVVSDKLMNKFREMDYMKYVALFDNPILVKE